MKRGKAWLALILVIALASTVLLAGCRRGGEGSGSLEPVKGGTLVVAHWEDPVSFNPDAKIDDAGASIYYNIFNKLVTLDVDYKVIPDLATDWDISPDGKTYTFHLAQGVKWHDGVPFTSTDVKWTFEAIINNHGSAYDSLSCIDTIETPDDNTVVIKLKDPNAPFLSFLAWIGTFIMPKHIYEGTDWLTNPANQKPIGTGPFKFVEWVQGDHITLEANPDYFAGAPYLDKVIFKIIPDSNTALQDFLNGGCDINNNRPPMSEIPTLQQTEGVKVDIKPMPSRYYIAFNLGKDPFKDLNVRKAVAMAIDGQDIVTRALQGLGSPAEGFYTPSIAWAYNADAKRPAFDVEAAKKLLDDAGYTKKADGFRFHWTLPYFTGQEWADMATVIKSQLAAIDIDVELQQLEIAAWMTKVITNKDFDLTILNGFQGPDPDNLRLRVGTGGGINVMGYSNPDIDALLEEAAKKLTPEERAPLYFQVQEKLAQDLPFIPYAEVVNIEVYHSRVHGLPWTEARGELGFDSFAKAWLENGGGSGGN